MDATKINFCNSSGFAIQNNRIKSDIIDKIINKHKIDLNMYEKSYNDSFIQLMDKFNMFSCFITRGKRYILYLTKINNENVSLLIELNSNDGILPKIIAIPLSINKDMFNETIFVGEMLLHNQNWTFIIDNCKINKGYSTHNKDAIEILKLCNDFISNKITINQLEPFDIKIKKFFAISQLKQELISNKIPLIGVKFLGLKNPIVFYFNSQNYNKEINKIKLLPRYDHNSDVIEKLQRDILNDYENQETSNNAEIIIDNIEKKKFTFEIYKSDNYGIYNLGLYKNNKIVDFGVARINTIELNVELINLLSDNNFTRVKSSFNKYFNKWEVIEITHEPLSDINEVINYQQNK